jgi:hypothetical protein
MDLTKASVPDGSGVIFLAKPYPFDGLADVLRKSFDGAG